MSEWVSEREWLYENRKNIGKIAKCIINIKYIIYEHTESIKLIIVKEQKKKLK